MSWLGRKAKESGKKILKGNYNLKAKSQKALNYATSVRNNLENDFNNNGSSPFADISSGGESPFHVPNTGVLPMFERHSHQEHHRQRHKRKPRKVVYY